MKSTALLTIALFFAIAPSPDANTMSEMTAGFLKADGSAALAASEFNPDSQIEFAKQQASVETFADTLAQNGL